MQNKKYLELDALAAPNGSVAPPTKEDLAYVVHFRKTSSGIRSTLQWPIRTNAISLFTLQRRHFFRNVLDFVVDRSCSDKSGVHL